MKCLLLPIVLLLVLLALTSSAQNVRPESSITMKEIITQMEGGIYERIINLGYISSPQKYKRGFTPQAHTEFTMVYFRFSDFEITSDGQAYVGKLFMSERYLESHYNKKYISKKAYEEDKDGFYMVCKLYFDVHTLEYRLNVYPEYVLNICRKNMHYNSGRCNSHEQHWKSLKYVAQLQDYHFDHFSQKDIPDSTRAFLKTLDPIINIRQVHLIDKEALEEYDSVAYQPSFAANNIIRTINLHKQIKIFKVGYLLDGSSIGKMLTLKLTKYPLSEDLLEGTEYTYELTPFDSLNDTQLAKRGKPKYFVSQNPLYRSLITSKEPDDQFIPGMDFNRNVQLAYPLDNKYYKRSLSPLAIGSALSKEYAQKDNSLKNLQKETDTLRVIPIQRVPDDLILISSIASRSNFWIYYGKENSSLKIPKDSVLHLHGSRYLRDTFPVFDSKYQVWLKGKLSYHSKKKHSPKSDSLKYICVIDDDNDIKWKINLVNSIPGQSGFSQHIWLNISVKKEEEASTSRRAPSATSGK